jgi:hypothetical protein
MMMMFACQYAKSNAIKSILIEPLTVKQARILRERYQFVELAQEDIVYMASDCRRMRFRPTYVCTNQEKNLVA